MVDKPVIMASWQPSFANAHPFLSDGFMRHEKVNFGALFLPNCTGICIKDEAQLCGFVGTIDNDIGMLFVDQKYQGLGLGKQLLQHALTDLAERGFNSAMLDVFEKNKPAVDLYQQAGFTLFERFLHKPSGEWLLHLGITLNA